MKVSELTSGPSTFCRRAYLLHRNTYGFTPSINTSTFLLPSWRTPDIVAMQTGFGGIVNVDLEVQKPVRKPSKSTLTVPPHPDCMANGARPISMKTKRLLYTLDSLDKRIDNDFNFDGSMLLSAAELEPATSSFLDVSWPMDDSTYIIKDADMWWEKSDLE